MLKRGITLFFHIFVLVEETLILSKMSIKNNKVVFQVSKTSKYWTFQGRDNLLLSTIFQIRFSTCSLESGTQYGNFVGAA